MYLASAWVKTDAANETANATSGETRLLAASVFTHALRGKFFSLCTPPPGAYLWFCPILTS